MDKEFNWECPNCEDFYFDIEEREYFPWGDVLNVVLHMRCTSCNHRFRVEEHFSRDWCVAKEEDE